MLHDLRDSADGRDGEPVRESFAIDDQVGSDAATPPLDRPTHRDSEAGLDLIEDQDCPHPSGLLAEDRKPFHRRGPFDDGLHHHDRQLIADLPDRSLRPLGIIERNCVVQCPHRGRDPRLVAG